MDAFPCFSCQEEAQNQESHNGCVDGHRKRVAEKVPGDIEKLTPGKDEKVERIMKKGSQKQDDSLNKQTVYHCALGKIPDAESGQGLAHRIETQMGRRIDILKPAGYETKYGSAELPLRKTDPDKDDERKIGLDMTYGNDISECRLNQ